MGDVLDMKPPEPRALVVQTVAPYRHASIVAALKAEPDLTHDQLAERFCIPRSRVARILSSDEFSLAMAAANEATLDTRGKFELLLSRSLDIINGKLDTRNREPQA